MYSITDLRKDALIQIKGVPYRVVDYQHTQLGRGGAIVKTKLKNLLDSSTISKTFKGSEKVEAAQIGTIDVQYLYRDTTHAHLMDKQTYEQLTVERSLADKSLDYAPEGSSLVAGVFEGKIIDIEVPKKVKLKVADTAPGARGNTATTALKPAKLETGIDIQVPLFIKTGDAILVDSSSGKYLGRV